MSQSRKYWIDDFQPDDATFWERTGKRIAWRNLVWSIFAENLGFSVWLMWSVVAARLPLAGFKYTTEQLFQLVAIPGLVGAILRFPYTFAVPKFGGRNWTIVSALLLLVPTSLLVYLVQRPDTPFWLMGVAAATAGFGGGNFSSSMANISFFFPENEKGFALGLNAAGGNLGVSMVQLFVPLVIGFALLPGAAESGIHLENAALIWMPFVVIAAIGAARYMDNLTAARSNFRDQVIVAQRTQTWIMSTLYIGTFGSFVGFSAALPLLLKTEFPQVTGNLAFLGALVGSVSRPMGGKLADRLGGAKVTLLCFGAMALASMGVHWALAAHSFGVFLAMFLLLFVITGIGNGSTFRMIPAIFRALHLRGVRASDASARSEALATARRESAAAIGFVAAIGALGGYFIPRAFSVSLKTSGSVSMAIVGFELFYVACGVITWFAYLRRSFLTELLPSLAEADA